MSNLIIKCPHCNDWVIIEEINCKIFRHGVYKSNFSQINPHLRKEECDDLIEKNSILGCGKPFKIENSIAVICEYI
jgi:hypothetical protein